MHRDLDCLTATTHDLLVVGGGIHGLFAAWLAAARGLSVALIERSDFGSGLSFNHQRTIHGGLRALESGNLAKVRQQIAERRVWATLAPALIQPVRFLLPVRRGEQPSRLSLAAGLRFYDLLSGDRNAGLPARLHLSASGIVSRQEVTTAFPGLPEAGLTGAAAWSDYQTIYPDRLNWLVAAAAIRAGALLANYVEARAGHRAGPRFAGVDAVDLLTGRPLTIRARATVIAAGSALGTLLPSLGLDDAAPPLVAVANVLVDRPASSHALAMRGPSGRRLTAVPWAGATLIGTFQGADITPPGAPFPLTLRAMLDELNATFPWWQVTTGDVRLVHRGIVPAVQGRRLELMPEAGVIHHASRGVSGVVSVIGVKYTTARLAAAAALDLVCPRRVSWRSTSHIPGPLPDAAVPEDVQRLDLRARQFGLDPETTSDLIDWYGEEATRILDVAEQTSSARRLSSETTVIDAEVRYAAEHALAPRLADVVLRRTRLGLRGRPPRLALLRAAELMAAARRWSDEERDAEIAAVDERFHTP